MADYTAKHGDSLWSIAEANKPTGMSTGEYWLKVKAANKGVKLFRGTKVALPSVPSSANAPGSNKSVVLAKTDSRNAPGSNYAPTAKTDSRNAPGSNASHPAVKADSRNSPGANVYKRPVIKSDARNAPGSNFAPTAKTDSRNAPGANASHIPAKSDSRNAPGSNESHSASKTIRDLATALAARSLAKKKK